MFQFPTNLHSFVSFGKTHKLHNAIDHWLAGVAGQAHVALDAVTEEERAVYAGHRGDGERAGQGGGKTAAEFWGVYGGPSRPTVGEATEGAAAHTVSEGEDSLGC